MLSQGKLFNNWLSAFICAVPEKSEHTRAALQAPPWCLHENSSAMSDMTNVHTSPISMGAYTSGNFGCLRSQLPFTIIQFSGGLVSGSLRTFRSPDA